MWTHHISNILAKILVPKLCGALSIIFHNKNRLRLIYWHTLMVLEKFSEKIIQDKIKIKKIKKDSYSALPLWPNITARWRGVFPKKKNKLIHIQVTDKETSVIAIWIYFSNPNQKSKNYNIDPWYTVQVSKNTMRPEGGCSVCCTLEYSCK